MKIRASFDGSHVGMPCAAASLADSIWPYLPLAGWPANRHFRTCLLTPLSWTPQRNARSSKAIAVRSSLAALAPVEAPTVPFAAASGAADAEPCDNNVACAAIEASSVDEGARARAPLAHRPSVLIHKACRLGKRLCRLGRKTVVLTGQPLKHSNVTRDCCESLFFLPPELRGGRRRPGL